MTLTEISARMGHSTGVLLSRYAHSPRDHSDHRRHALNALTAEQSTNVLPFPKEA
jgi:hypothetical protein